MRYFVRARMKANALSNGYEIRAGARREIRRQPRRVSETFHSFQGPQLSRVHTHRFPGDHCNDRSYTSIGLVGEYVPTRTEVRSSLVVNTT